VDIQARLTAMEEWLDLRTRCPWPEQQRYEILRSVVLFGHSPAERALETGVPRASLYRRIKRFKDLGMVSLFTDIEADDRPSRPSLPPDMRQFIVDLKAEHPPFRPNEIATICELRFGRRPSPHTVQRVLADGPSPSRTLRRYPPYHQIADPADARHAVITLHYEGWNAKSIAAYLGTSRQTVHTILRRWVEEGRFGLDDKTPGPKPGVRKAGFRAVAAIKNLQKNELLGEFRVSAALKQMGIQVPARTCGRIMAHHRALYGRGQHKKEPKEKKPMPFAASRRHEIWTTDIRYLDTPLLGQQAYCVTILDNFSRAIVASIVSPTQDQAAYLKVLRDAVRDHGSPERLVSDGGGVFKSNAAKAVYAALGIEKEQIAKRQPWMSYIEANFGVQRRMADYAFAQVVSWPALRAVHDQWVTDFNWQDHWAHRQRQDGRHAPAEVLGFVHGRVWTRVELDRAFRFRSGRTIDRHGYVRYANWRLYGERALVGQPAVVWRCGDSLLVEHQDVPLAQFAVDVVPDTRLIRAVKEARLFETGVVSPQPFLPHCEDVEWRLALRVRRYALRRKRVVTGRQERLFPVAVDAS